MKASGRTYRVASIAVLAALTATLACSHQSSLRNKVEELFAAWNKFDEPGCSDGVSRHGTTLHERGYGSANLDLAVPMSSASVLNAASISKQLTAMSILLLARRGQLSLDDDVARYIADWGEREYPVTIRHLLSHTSGLRDAFVLQGLRPEHPENINDQIVSILTQARGLNFAPGSRFEYNNGAYRLLAAIVERVSGRTFSVFARENIFKPLGMAHSYIHDDATQIMPNRATGYSRGPDGFRMVVRTYTDVVVGNSGLFSTVGDVLRWQQNFMAPRVGDVALVAAMERPVIATGWSDTSRYGLGVEVAQHRGLRVVAHGGGDQGVRSYVVRYPERGLAIAILCNRDDMDPAPVARSIADVFLQGEFPEGAKEAPAQAPATTTISLPVSALQDKAGLYRDVSDDSVGRIFVRDGKLMAGAGDGNEYELTPVAPNRFVIIGTPVRAEFVASSGGKPQELRVTGVGAETRVSRLIAPFTPSKAELRAFAGTYTSDEVDGTYTNCGRCRPAASRPDANGYQLRAGVHRRIQRQDARCPEVLAQSGRNGHRLHGD